MDRLGISRFRRARVVHSSTTGRRLEAVSRSIRPIRPRRRRHPLLHSAGPANHRRRVRRPRDELQATPGTGLPLGGGNGTSRRRGPHQTKQSSQPTAPAERMCGASVPPGRHDVATWSGFEGDTRRRLPSKRRGRADPVRTSGAISASGGGEEGLGKDSLAASHRDPGRGSVAGGIARRAAAEEPGRIADIDEGRAQHWRMRGRQRRRRRAIRPRGGC